ncbi:hypothetical protein CF65_00653 [Aggregatibacter actinomycetemcomitans HK1651]|nr:hypothetical protein CF65_00653 [Aggregatibacter actinomycetemcomitans HK1651]
MKSAVIKNNIFYDRTLIKLTNFRFLPDEKLMSH